MKPTVVSTEALFDAHRASLRWEWIADRAHPERRFDEVVVRNAQSAADLVGYLNYIHPYRIQIVGRREMAYLEDCSDECRGEWTISSAPSRRSQSGVGMWYTDFSQTTDEEVRELLRQAADDRQQQAASQR